MNPSAENVSLAGQHGFGREKGLNRDVVHLRSGENAIINRNAAPGGSRGCRNWIFSGPFAIGEHQDAATAIGGNQTERSLERAVEVRVFRANLRREPAEF